jgi:RNase P subunit RPR2
MTVEAGEIWAHKPKFHKKKKKHVGEEWQGPSREDLEAAQRASGIICRDCHKLKPWKKLSVHYRKVSKKRMERTWECDDCGNIVRTEEIHLKKGTVTRVRG